MKSTVKRIASAIVLVVLCLALCVCAAACAPQTTPEPPTPPVKVADGIDLDLGVGDSKIVTVADYITVNNNAVSAKSDSANASAAVEEGLLTVTGVAEGAATVTLTCGDITVTFDVTVYAKCAVTVDGKATYVKKGGTYTLPAAPTIADADMEFDYWLVGTEHKAPGSTITVDVDVTVTSVPKRKAPVKVKDGEVTVYTSGTAKKELDVADYITTHGNNVTAKSDDEAVVTVAIDNGKIVLTAVAEGEATVTVSCGAVKIELDVTVSQGTPESYTVTVDDEVVATVNAGETYKLPKAPTVDSPDFEFKCWKVADADGVIEMQPGETVTVESDITVTANIVRKAVEKIKNGITVNLKVDGDVNFKTVKVSDYIDTHGNKDEHDNPVTVTAVSQDETKATAAISGDTLTVTAVAVGNTTVTLTCDTVTVTFTVKVTSVEDGSPEFEDGDISFDLYTASSGTYEFVFTAPADSNYTYAYTVTPDTGVSVSGNTLTYTATAAVKNLELNVEVTATDDKYGEKTASFTVTVNVTDTTPVPSDSALTDPTVHDLYSGALTVDLTSNIDNPSGYLGTYKVNNEEVVDPTAYAVTGSYTDTATDVVLNVAATFGTKTVEYTYTVKVIDSTAYRMVNGGFDADDHVSGWSGLTGTFSNYGKYFEKQEEGFEGYDYNNDGFYYVGTDDGIETITSPEFIVGNSGWITFKLGSMRPYDENGVRKIYVEVKEKGSEDEEFIAKVANVLFADPERAHRLNDYKLDLSAYKGKTVYIKAVDKENGGNFRSLGLDAFNTWWDADPGAGYTDLSIPYVLDAAVNIDLKDTNAGEVDTVVYSKGIISALEGVFPTGAVQGGATGLTLGSLDKWNKVTATKCGVYTVVYSLKDKEVFTATVTVVNTVELPTLSDREASFEYSEWFDGTTGTQVSVGLPTPTDGSKLSYAFDVANVTGGASVESFTIEEGNLRYTPSGAGTIVVAMEVTVTYSGDDYNVELEEKATFNVTLIFMDNTISLKGSNVIQREHDVNDLTDNQKLVVDFAEYINVPSDKTATYSVTLNGDTAATLDGSTYTITFADETLSDVATDYVFAVTATEGATTLDYTVTVKLTDTYQYRIKNGGFDSDLSDWTLSNPGLGAVNNATKYWDEEVPFNNDGKFFNAYTNFKDGDPTVAKSGNEGATGTLTSSTFKVGGNGWMTYKLGGAKNKDVVYIEVVRVADNKAVKLLNYDWNDFEMHGCRLVPYKVNLIDYCGFEKGDEVFVRVTDNGTADYGLFFLDSVVTYYTEEPGSEYSVISDYRLYNGSFERDLENWTVDGDIGVVTADSKYWHSGDPANIGNEYNKDGAKLFSWWTWNPDFTNNEGVKVGAEVNRETNTGTLTSGEFILKAGQTISFKFAGGHANQHGIYIEVVEKGTNVALAKFYNIHADNGTLIQYHYTFNTDTDKTCYIRVVDNATGDWGCFAVDSFFTYGNVVETGIEAVNQLTA